VLASCERLGDPVLEVRYWRKAEIQTETLPTNDHPRAGLVSGPCWEFAPRQRGPMLLRRGEPSTVTRGVTQIDFSGWRRREFHGNYLKRLVPVAGVEPATY
jgi:hypothetical protein